jgi:hypothetical protein
MRGPKGEKAKDEEILRREKDDWIQMDGNGRGHLFIQLHQDLERSPTYLGHLLIS